MSLSTEFPHGPMRRKDREITDRAEIDAILHETKVMHLALADNNIPFVVPVFFAYDGEALYFHSARAGSKIELLKKNPRVCFEISLAGGVIESDSACDFEAQHRTAIGSGTATFIEDAAEKTTALNRIVARFTTKAFVFPAPNLAATAVVRIAIDSIKGKKHGF
jgi:nitroimidazol reductase NimA-like FMN-containing flavoprotein (pyridoxamine 5'-phosphate oxidase superfamily)